MRESKLLWRQRRALALLLTLCLLLTCMPLPALSVNETAARAGEAANASDEVYIIDEDVTKRGEFEKHFLCSDGTYRAVTYAEPVHHYDSGSRRLAGQRRLACPKCRLRPLRGAERQLLPSRLPSPTPRRLPP